MSLFKSAEGSEFRIQWLALLIPIRKQGILNLGHRPTSREWLEPADSLNHLSTNQWVENEQNKSGAQPDFYLGGGGVNPKAIYNLNLLLKLML
jgi:hypothetical protein